MEKHLTLEGEVAFEWKVVGNLEQSAVPLIVALHGGPGAGNDYMIGCGRSTYLPENMGDETFRTYELFVRELNSLVDHLDLWDKSFCGVYAAQRPRGLKKLVLLGFPASMPFYNEVCKYRLAHSPSDVRQTIEECEKRGDHDSLAYKEASTVFMRRLKNLKENPTTYVTMQGPSEFATIGTLKYWQDWKDTYNI
ncbi:proline-specific peptidase [Biscogniauxia marginata]|nr:proline-specific peptidase [Biscogniauxia marginata]